MAGWDKPDDDTIIVDVIDRAGTRHEFARVAPADAWPAVSELILEGARAEAARYHGTTQAYNAGDPTTPLPEADDEYATGEAYRHDEDDDGREEA